MPRQLPVDYQGASAYLTENDNRKLARNFQRANGDDVGHVVAELVAGVFIAKAGFMPQYERKYERKKPDWTGLHPDGSIAFFSDVVNCHHTDEERERVERDLRAAGWSHFESDGRIEQGRLYASIKCKADAYRDLALSFNLPYVIFAHGTYDSNLHKSEVSFVVNMWEPRLFPQIPHVSGVCFMGSTEQGLAGFGFTYFENEYGDRPIRLTDCDILLPIR